MIFVSDEQVATGFPEKFKLKESPHNTREFKNHTDSLFFIGYETFILRNEMKFIINFLQKSVTNRIVILYDFTIDANLLSILIHKLICDKKIKPQQFVIMLSSQYDKKQLINEFKKNQIEIPVYCYNAYFDIVYETHLAHLNKVFFNKKFSLFARRYDDDRFKLLLELVDKNLIKEFVFTFTNCHAEIREYPYTLIEKEDLYKKAVEFNYHGQNINDWINGLPYCVDLENFENPFYSGVYDLYKQSYINIILESNLHYQRGIDNQPIGLILTEKTYKAIFMKKPFLFYGRSLGLTVLRNEGFKTFEPYINPSYDDLGLETDDKVKLISDEVFKIVNMNDSEFRNLIDNLNEIAEFNYSHATNLAKQNKKELEDLLSYLNLNK